jgi:hypothetical protein
MHVSDEVAFANLPDNPAFTPFLQYEWVDYGWRNVFMLLGWSSDLRGLILVDEAGDRTLVYDCESVTASSIIHAPVCWLSFPDDTVMAQKPISPAPLDIKDFLESVELWRETVTDCHESFRGHEDDVDHLLYCRDYLEIVSTQHPAVRMLPEWQTVLALDIQFRDYAVSLWQDKRDRSPPAWTQDYTQWWLRAGWEIYVAVGRMNRRAK